MGKAISGEVDGIVPAGGRSFCAKAYTWPSLARDSQRCLAGGYRPWAELLARTFVVELLACSTCQGRMKLLGLVKDAASIARLLAAAGEGPEVPRRSPGRGQPYWKSRVLRLKVLGEEDDGGGRGRGADEVGRVLWRGADHGAVRSARLAG